jgi:peptidoglycan/xylan/chitin deacetylase (PgdA/CDA1 family)
MALPPHRVDYLPIIDRPTVRWPGGARVAFWVAPNVEHYEYLPPRDPSRNAWTRTPHPEVQGYSYRDYGNRVGFWRMHEVLDRLGVRATVSLNLAVYDHYPEVGAAMTASGWEVMSHGIYNTRYLHALSEQEEREFYRDCVDSLRRHTGEQLRGMLGPAISNSISTPDLMAEAGLIYHADWLHDDQPIPIKVETGRLVSVPYTTELNDVPVFMRHTEADDFVRMAKAQFDQLWREGEESGRVMCLALHPYLFGMPHRIRHLEEMLDYVLSHDGVWQTTAGDIAQHFLDHHYDEFVTHAASLGAAGGNVGDVGEEVGGAR